jgi:endo-1,4-beta-D-glucanase Y
MCAAGKVHLRTGQEMMMMMGYFLSPSTNDWWLEWVYRQKQMVDHNGQMIEMCAEGSVFYGREPN